MFTGIVECRGEVVSITPIKEAFRLTVRPAVRMEGVKIGESVAVNGVCLTVVKAPPGRLEFDAIPETMRKTSLGDLAPGSALNLERALKWGDRLGGHYVLGHVEGTGTIHRFDRKGKDVEILIRVPGRIRAWLLPKGSVAVDGVSLTVGRVLKNDFSIYLIPHTLKITNLGTRRAGDRVNIETDILARSRKAAREFFKRLSR